MNTEKLYLPSRRRIIEVDYIFKYFNPSYSWYTFYEFRINGEPFLPTQEEIIMAEKIIDNRRRDSGYVYKYTED